MEVLQRTANRGSISTGEYEIANSIKIEPANDEGLYFTPSSTTNTDTFTFSCWFKRTEISNQINTLFGSYTDGSNHALFRFKTDDTLELRFVTAGTGKILVSDMLFRDTSAWYHMVLAVDTTDGTTANRVKVYINGEQITLTGDYPNQNQDCIGINTASKAMNVGYLSNFANVEFAGYIAEAHHIDGSQLAPTEFGEFDNDSGIWKPKAFSGSYGTNGFYLDFEDNTSAGKDTSGNNNNFSDTNLNAADHATDTPTNNFATGNPLVPLKANTILTNGATNYKNVGSAGWSGFASSIAVQSGKWYVEFTAAGATTMCGVGNINDFLNSIYYGNWNTSIGFYGTAGLLFIDGATSGAGPNNTWTGTAYGNGDIVGIALDKDNGCVYMSVNGTFANSGDPTSGASKTGGVELTKGNSDYSASDYFYIGASHNIDNGVLQANYGGYTTDTPSSAATDANGYGTFEYAPPSGYYALCTKNLAEYG